MEVLPECIKELSKVLNMPELKITKLSDTQWLAHTRCVKVSYSAL